jgi:hypothetical protein
MPSTVVTVSLALCPDGVSPGTSAMYREPLCRRRVLPSSEWCPAPPQRALPLLRCSYGLMRPTTLLARLSASLYRAALQVAASPCWKMVVPDVISACLSLDAWTLTPAACWVPLPITSPPPSAFPQSLWVGSPRNSVQRLPNGGDFGAAVIHSCSGLEVCCHPGRSHRRVPHGAAVAFTSEQNTGRYLPVHRIC